MYSVWISLWIAMWAVLIVTLPFHLLLHGIVAYRIAQQEGWGAVFRKGRYLREIRQHRVLSRMMLGWLVIAFLEICGLMALSVLVFMTRNEVTAAETMRVGSIPESGDILLVSTNTLWRFDTEDYTLLPAVSFAPTQAIMASITAPDGTSVYLNVTRSALFPDVEDVTTGIMQLSFDDHDIYQAFNQEYIFIEAISPDGDQAMARFQTCSACEPELCLLDLDTGRCPSIDWPDIVPIGNFHAAYWIDDNRIVASFWGQYPALAEFDPVNMTWGVLTEGELIAVAPIPDQHSLLVHRANTVAVYDLDSATFEPVPNIRNDIQPVSLSVSPDGNRAVMTTAAHLTVFEIATGEVLYERDIPIGREQWMADSTRLVLFGDREDRMRQEYEFQLNLFNPIKITQVNYPFTTLMIVNIETGEIERTLSLEDAPSHMMLVP